MSPSDKLHPKALALKELNLLLSAVLSSLESTVPNFVSTSLGKPKIVGSEGVYAALSLCAVTRGKLNGKLTFVADWETAFAITKGSDLGKAELSEDEVKWKIEKVLKDVIRGVAQMAADAGISFEWECLPMVSHSNIISGLDVNAVALVLPIYTRLGPLEFHLSVKEFDLLNYASSDSR